LFGSKYIKSPIESIQWKRNCFSASQVKKRQSELKVLKGSLFDVSHSSPQETFRLPFEFAQEIVVWKVREKGKMGILYEKG
jgi:hypothetical protein